MHVEKFLFDFPIYFNLSPFRKNQSTNKQIHWAERKLDEGEKARNISRKMKNKSHTGLPDFNGVFVCFALRV